MGKTLPIKYNYRVKITDKIQLSGKITDKTPGFIDKITDIYIYISQHPHSSSNDIAIAMGKSKESAKKYLQYLISIELVKPEGSNRNRSYSISQ